MTYPAILIASVFLLAAFGVERLSHVLGLPAVIVLVALGFFAKPLLASFGFALDGLGITVPVVGTIGPVSYTHLDVYKRQTSDWPTSITRISPHRSAVTPTCWSIACLLYTSRCV